MAPVTDDHQAGPGRDAYECSIAFTMHPCNGPAERLTCWCTAPAHLHLHYNAKNLSLLTVGAAFPRISATPRTRTKPCGEQLPGAHGDQAAFCVVPKCHYDGSILPSSPHAAKPANSSLPAWCSWYPLPSLTLRHGSSVTAAG